MAIYYIDLNGGNDANDGLSFANRKKTFDGLISDNDNNSDQDIQGDEFRVMGMPIVNTGVNATWTKGGWSNHDANGNTISNITINDATAGTPISISTNNAHGFVTGDIVWVYNVRGIPAANGTWIVTVTGTNTFTLNNSSGTGTYVSSSDSCSKVTHKGIKVNTGCKRIAFCSGTSQTDDNTYNTSNNLYGVASSNVTVERANPYLGVQDIEIEWSNSFTTGKAWYYTLPETLDLSAFQRISFRYRASNQTADAQTSHISIKLCTDTIGDVVAHTMSIPGFKDNSGNFPIVHDFGTNLNSAIKSVALYVDSDVGQERVRLRNIIAVKDANDGVSHCDVIGKNTTAEPVWWQCQYIQEDHMLFGKPTGTSTSDFENIRHDGIATYAGTGETVALHKLTPYNYYENGQDYNQTNYNKLIVKIRYNSKTSADQTKLLGGWDQTNMTTQDSVTWVNMGSDEDTLISTRAGNNNTGRILIDRFGQCQGIRLIEITGFYNTLKNLYSAGTFQNVPIRIVNDYTRRGFVIDGVYQTMGNNGVHGMQISNAFGFVEDQAKFVFKNVHVYGTGSSRWDEFPPNNVVFENFYYNSVQMPFRGGDQDQGRIDVKNLFASGWRYIIPYGSVRIHNSTIDGLLNEVYPWTVNNFGTTNIGEMSFRNYNGVANDHRIYLSHGTIKSETSVRHGTDGIAWKIQPLIEHSGDISFSALQNVDENPLAFTVAKIFVEANKLVTFTAYLRRTNTGLTLRVAARRDKMGNYLSIPSDAVANCTASADTWQEVTLTFTPTDSAEITIDCEAFGGNSYTGYIDDISVTQAS